MKSLSLTFAALALGACTERTSGTPAGHAPSPTPLVTQREVNEAAGAPIVSPPTAPKATPPTEPIDRLALPHNVPAVDHLALAKQWMASDDMSLALDEARRALYLSPNDEDALIAIAQYASRQKRFDLSAEAWDRLATLRGDDATARIENARALLHLKKPQLAVSAALSATQIDSENAEAFHLLGRAHMEEEAWAQAIVAFKTAIALNPQHGWAHNNLGFAYLRTNQNTRAAAVLERAVELLPNSGRSFNNLGVALERIGRTESARGAYARATELSPRYVKARINVSRMAQLDMQTGEIDEGDQHPMHDETQSSLESPIDNVDANSANRIDLGLE